MNIKLLHHKDNVVSSINPKFQAIMTIISEVIAVLVSPYAFGIFLKKLLSTQRVKYNIKLNVNTHNTEQQIVTPKQPNL